MPVIDVDSHFMEPMDWLEVTAPRLAEQIAPPVTFLSIVCSSSKTFWESSGRSCEAQT